MKCRSEGCKNEGTVQGLWKPWTTPVKLCRECAERLKDRRWYGQE